MPVFFEGELVGFSANTAHHVDIGAATPGLIIDVPDVWAEGMLLDGVKLYNEGVRNEDSVEIHPRQHAGAGPRDGRPGSADRVGGTGGAAL